MSPAATTQDRNAELAFWLTRMAYLWRKQARSSLAELRYAEAAMQLHESIEFAVKALCYHLDVRFPKKHFQGMEKLVELAEKVDRVFPGTRDSILAVSSSLIGHDEEQRNLARYGYEGAEQSGFSPERMFNHAYCSNVRSSMDSLMPVLTRVQQYRRWNRRPIRIGVLSSQVNPNDRPCQPMWSEAVPQTAPEWQVILGPGTAVSEVSIPDLTEDYAMLINPFGEAYPEVEGQYRASYRRIVAYVENGGVLANSAGLPFFYAWELSSGRFQAVSTTTTFLPTRIEILGDGKISAEMAQAITFEGTLSSREFGVRTTFDAPGRAEPLSLAFSQTQAGRDAIGPLPRLPESYQIFRSPTSFPLGTLSLIEAEDPVFHRVTPIALVPKGEGFALFSGLNLKGREEADLLIECVRGLARWGVQHFVPPQERSTMSSEPLGLDESETTVRSDTGR